jgi:hypothetical protein
MGYATALEEGVKFVGNIFTTIIAMEGLDTLAGLLFDMGFEVKELAEDFILLLEEVDEGHARFVINESKIILGFANGVNAHRTTHIGVYDFE